MNLGESEKLRLMLHMPLHMGQMPWPTNELTPVHSVFTLRQKTAPLTFGGSESTRVPEFHRYQ